MRLMTFKKVLNCTGNERSCIDGHPVLSGLRWAGIGPDTQAAQLV